RRFHRSVPLIHLLVVFQAGDCTAQRAVLRRRLFKVSLSRDYLIGQQLSRLAPLMVAAILEPCLVACCEVDWNGLVKTTDRTRGVFVYRMFRGDSGLQLEYEIGRRTDRTKLDS